MTLVAQETALDKAQVSELILQSKRAQGLTWEQVGKSLGRRAIGAATVCYGYAQFEEAEADKVIELFDLPPGSKAALMAPPMRVPVQPWPPTDPFVYRFYEAVMLYGPAWKDVCHEIFGDGIISAIDCYFDVTKVIDDQGIARAHFVFEGKWLVYKKF